MCSYEETIQSIKKVAKETLPSTGSMILFGSRARGDYHAESDWDILVLLDKERLTPTDYDTVTYPLTMLGWKIGESINPVMYTKKEWESYSISPFYKNVEREGVVLI